VRPEIIRIATDAAGAGNGGRPGIAWRGVARQRIFRGARNLYTVETGAHGGGLAALRVTVDAPPDQTVALGSAVTLTVDAAQTWAVRD